MKSFLAFIAVAAISAVTLVTGDTRVSQSAAKSEALIAQENQYGAHNYVVSDSAVLDGIELGFRTADGSPVSTRAARPTST